MMAFDWMTDEQLRAAAARELELAHSAEKRASMGHDGEGHLNGNWAFADRSRDWAALQAEVKRRGLS